ncbi:MAG: tetratricopeptide repeat protein, partial [Akkermansiaceae bacterium]|nr:tetratricopeptide repeat protein [Armatimonadota bacterium]
PGGVGKTRLSIAVADAALSQFSDGVWFVDFAPLAEGAYVAETVAQTLGVSQEAGHSAEERLIAELRSRSLLLVFDNCEHLLDSSAALASRLLSTCPDLRILTTSRQALGVTGEQVYPVPSLNLPSLSGREGVTDLLTIEKNPAFLLEYAGIQLFVQRAVQANPAFRLDRRNALAVVDVCQQLDGIPLAIELAAARLRSLSVGDVQTRLTDRFRLLNNGSRSALPRQQTLRAALDWSYKLLSGEEQVLLNRLSLFTGGWTLEAAEKVGPDDDADAWDVLDTLTALVEKSLVVYEQRGEARYHLLETVRQYAGEKLAETGQVEAYRHRHCEYFLALAERIGPELSKADQALWLDRLETEHDNLRQAISFSAKESDDVQMGLRIVGAVSPFWVRRDHLKEARQHCAVLLSREHPPALTPPRATALVLAGNLAYCQGDNSGAQQHFEDALAVWQHLDNRRGSISALGSLGNVAHIQGEYAKAQGLFEEALALCREIGGVPNWEAVTLTCLGNVTFDRKDYAASRLYAESSLELCRRIGNRDTEGITLSALGRIALHQGVPADAIRFYEQALVIEREIGNVSKEAKCLCNLGLAQAALGNIVAAGVLHCQSLSLYQEASDQRPIAAILETIADFLIERSPSSMTAACRILGAAEKFREDTGTARLSSEQDIYDRAMPRLHSALSDEAFAGAWAQGRTMTTAEAVTCAIQETEAMSSR